MVGEFGEPWDCGEGVEVAAVLLTIDSLPTHLPIYIPYSAKNGIHNLYIKSLISFNYFLPLLSKLLLWQLTIPFLFKYGKIVYKM